MSSKVFQVLRNDQSGIKLIFRALRHRNYRLFFGGQAISLVGTWMQQVAMSWLVYRLTNSAVLLGLVGFLSQVPSFFLAPFAGVLADRWNRHRIVVATQTLSMLQAFVLAFLTLAGAIAIWHVLFLSLFLGLVNAIDMPARQSFVVELIEEREDLGNAIALNSSMVNVARMVGPSVAGVLVGTVGEGLCFLFNAVSFVAVIGALLAMRVKPSVTKTESRDALHELKEGLIYSFGFLPIRSVLLLIGLVSLVGMPYTVLMPIFAKDILHGGPHLLGFLMGASGVGALAGGIYLASKRSMRGLGKVLAIAAGVLGLSLVVFSLSRTMWLSLAVMPVAGFAMIVQMAASNTIIQTIVDDDKRGRVMSFFTMAFVGMSPFGSLLAGALANLMGAPYAVLIGGVVCVLAALWFSRKLPTAREIMRHIYEKKGVIPR